MKLFRTVVMNTLMAAVMTVSLCAMVGFAVCVFVKGGQGDVESAGWLAGGFFASVLLFAGELTVMILVNETPEERNQRRELDRVDEIRPQRQVKEWLNGRKGRE